jgi:transposase
MEQSLNIVDRLQKIEELLHQLVERETAKEWYTTEEAAKKLGRAEFTVREWCRLGRIDAQKRQTGRGKYQSWVISHDELERYQREGLLPQSNGRLAA